MSTLFLFRPGMSSASKPTALLALSLGAAALALSADASAQITDAWRLIGLGREHFFLVVDSTDAVYSQSSLRLETDELLADSVWGAVEGAITIRPLQGEHLRIRAYVRTNDVRGETFGARVDGEQDGHHVTWGHDTRSDRPLLGTTSWQQYELVVPPPEER